MSISAYDNIYIDSSFSSDDVYYYSHGRKGSYKLDEERNICKFNMDHIYEEILSPCKRLKVSERSLPDGRSRLSERSQASSNQGHPVIAPQCHFPPKGTHYNDLYNVPQFTPPVAPLISKGKPLKVLQNEGQLKVSAYMNFGLLTVHVIQARHLTCKGQPLCDAYVKMALVPDDSKKSRCKTNIVWGSNNPLFDDKFSFELLEEDYNKRLYVSVWHKASGSSEFLGCMSFGVRHLLNPKKEVGGWYYLLTEEIGRKKHLQVSNKQKPQLKLRNETNIPSVNKDVWGMEPLTVTVQRGKHGFGFSVIDSCPVKVGRVDGVSPAETAGLHPGDCIIRINNQNVSRSQAVSVAKLVKTSGNTLVIDLQRPCHMQMIEQTPWHPTHPSSPIDVTDVRKGQDYNHSGEYSDDSKENEISVDEGIFSLPSNLITSTPLPLFMNGHQTVHTPDRRKQEAIHRLLSIELDFIDLMHAGMQRYSRPLRHCILSQQQHSALFQNIEKLVTISEYHVKQINDNVPSPCSDTDTSITSSEGGQQFIHSIGMIYQSKVHMLCQAYDLYSKGLGDANQVLSDLRKCAEFIKFIREPPTEPQQPTISAFISRPVQHIRELYQVLREIFVNTCGQSQDFKGLKEVVEGLQECVTSISNYSCVDRVPSLTSLTSSSVSGSSNDSQKGCLPPSCSMQTIRSMDSEVVRIQDRLVFPPNVRVFQLSQEERHLIYSGALFKWEGTCWKKLHVLLFSDMILQTEKDKDENLHVVHEPLYLRDIIGIDGQRKHTTEIVLHCNQKSRQGSSVEKMLYRAPSTEEKYAWKSLMEQRVHNVKGSLEYFSSSDCSNSAVII